MIDTRSIGIATSPRLSPWNVSSSSVPGPRRPTSELPSASTSSTSSSGSGRAAPGDSIEKSRSTATASEPTTSWRPSSLRVLAVRDRPSMVLTSTSAAVAAPARTAVRRAPRMLRFAMVSIFIGEVSGGGSCSSYLRNDPSVGHDNLSTALATRRRRHVIMSHGWRQGRATLGWPKPLPSCRRVACGSPGDDRHPVCSLDSPAPRAPILCRPGTSPTAAGASRTQSGAPDSQRGPDPTRSRIPAARGGTGGFPEREDKETWRSSSPSIRKRANDCATAWSRSRAR